MVRSNDYSHGGSRPGFSDLSEYTTSTSATPLLHKLVSLEIVGTNTSQSPEPGVIDLTQALSDDYDDDDDDDDDAVAAPDDDDLTTGAVHQYVVTVHDDETVFAQSGSVISQPSHREHATNDASTALSSYLPNPYNEYATSDYNDPASHYRVPSHRAMKGASSENGHFTNPRSHTNKTKNGRGDIIEHKPSVLGSLLQCVNPTLPGESDDVPKMWMAKSRVMKAMVSDEDALDRVFNTVEKYTCRNDEDIGREMRKELRQREDPEGRYAAPRHKSHYKCVTPDLSDFACGTPDFSRWKASTRQRKPNKSEDMLDVVFGELESYVCSDQVNERYMQNSTYQKDALDAVFEHFENLTCRDDITAANLQSRGLRTLRKIPREKDWTPSHTGNNKPFRHYPPGADMLERFGRDFEQTMCTTELAKCGHEGDFVDNVFDGLEQTTCRDQPPKEGGYFDTSVYDLDDQNSLVYSPSESKDWYPPRLMRKPSWGNTKPSKKPNRKIDPSGYVEGLRAPGRYPRDDDSYRSSSSKARAKHSLERIRAIRERYFSNERYYRDDGHY